MQNILEQFKLTGKKAIVVGGAGDLGIAMVEAISEAGAQTVVIDYDDRVFDMCDTLKNKGLNVINDYFNYDQDGRIKSNFRGKDLNLNVLDKMKDTWNKTNKPEKKKEEPEKDKLLNKLVATARSHAKNGISVEGLKDFFNKLQEYKKTNPPKLQSQLAGVLYNFLNKNIQMGKKKLPNNMNNALKELGYKEIKK